MGSYRVTVVGSGYVGLTSATCLAQLGHRVVCVDNDTAKVATVREGRVPFHEPGLDQLLRDGLASGRLRVTTALRDAVRDADVVLLCVATPMGDDGSADLGVVRTVLAEMRTSLPSGCVVVTKSTVPVGTSRRIRGLLGRSDISVASNPEFLREGTAVRDFLQPDRIVIGADDAHARDRLSGLYEAIAAPRVWTDPASAELTKYAANAMLALRISYANLLAELCENVGADIRDVTEAMGYDERIGPAFLRPGPGWGGSCLPKDAHELVRAAASASVDAGMVREAIAVNDRQARRVVARTRRLATGSDRGSLRGVRVGLLGLAFKAGTDDLRDSPALTVARLLGEDGADLTAYDPCVSGERAAEVAPVVVVDDPYRVAKGASTLVVLTEWPEFRRLDWVRLADAMVRPVVLDTRNHLPADDLRAAAWPGTDSVSADGPSCGLAEGPSWGLADGHSCGSARPAASVAKAPVAHPDAVTWSARDDIGVRLRYARLAWSWIGPTLRAPRLWPPTSEETVMSTERAQDRFSSGAMGGWQTDRRHLLRLGALGTGLLMASSLAVGSGGRGAHAATKASVNRPRILDGDRYPIGLWVAPPPSETTVERYAEIAAAGFTFVIGIDGCGGFCAPGETTTAENAAMLDAAWANDLLAIVFDTRISNVHVHPRDQWRRVIADVLREYEAYPAFAGFDLRDEPHASLFSYLGDINDTLRELDPSVLGYVNLFPTYASPEQLGTSTYQEHLDRYVAEAHPDFISFDHYPLIGPSPTTRGDYFYNWVLVRDRALRSGLPTWVFILACEHYGYRLPTEAELLWQVNVSLAYGCKGIQYFTYWTPPLPGFQQALVTVDGQLTPLYYAAQRVNNDHLQPVGRQLLPLVSESVTHAGETTPPVGVEVFTGDDWVASTSGSPVILGRFHDGKHKNLRWLLVTNRAFDAAATTTLSLRRDVSTVFEFDPARERFVPVRTAGGPEDRSLTVNLSPGAARLYRLHTNQRDGHRVDP